MFLRALAVCSVLCAVVTVWPSRAEAELPRPYGVTEGWFIEGMFSGNGVTDDEFVEIAPDSDIDPMVGLGLQVGYRPIDWVSVGVLVHYGFLIADSDLEEDVAGFLGVLAEVQGHLPVSRFDPWIGFGFGYAMAFGHAWGDWRNFDYDYRISLHGIGLAVSVGMNIFITRQLALGPFFRMIFGAYPTACYAVEQDMPSVHEEDCDNIDDAYEDLFSNEPDDKPHLWSVGVNLSYVFD